MSVEQHKTAASALKARCIIITLSDTRGPSTDTSGRRIIELLEAAGHAAAHYAVIPDDPMKFSALLDASLARDDADAIFTTGGTGVSRRDQTIDVIDNALTTPLPGFGELFRMLSWEQLGSAALLSRATGGVARGKLLFAMPGSKGAVELAMTRLILPELGHLLGELRK
jgi:molybdenum cofactor biosynthesis protein B